MYCSKCGNETGDTDNYCTHCGNKQVLENKKSDLSPRCEEEDNLDDAPEYIEYIIEKVRKAGNSVLAVGIIGLIISIILEIINGYLTADISILVPTIILDFTLFGILINSGDKLRNDDCEDLSSSLKRINNTIFFIIFLILLSLFFGSFPGLLIILAIFDLSKAKKLLKEEI